MGTTSPLLYVCRPTEGLVVPPPGGLTAIVRVRVVGGAITLTVNEVVVVFVIGSPSASDNKKLLTLTVLWVPIAPITLRSTLPPETLLEPFKLVVKPAK